jgi:hypothetical protein
MGWRWQTYFRRTLLCAGVGLVLAAQAAELLRITGVIK